MDGAFAHCCCNGGGGGGGDAAQRGAHFRRVVTLRRPQFSQARQVAPGSALWRYMLLTDGHIAQQLSIAARAPLQLRLLQERRAAAAPSLPRGERLAAPAFGFVERRIALHLPAQQPLLYASSVWSSVFHAALMTPHHRHRPLWDVFAARKLCVSRSILALHFGLCPHLAPLFGVPPDHPMWARDYVFRHNRAVFLHVHEIFSPTLVRFLGTPVPPPELLLHKPHFAHTPDSYLSSPL